MQPISSPSSSLFPGFAECRLALADQVEMAYLDNGGGDHPPLVLLHGVFDNKATWFRLAARLPGRRIIAPDLIGHGHSSKPTFTSTTGARALFAGTCRLATSRPLSPRWTWTT